MGLSKKGEKILNKAALRLQQGNSQYSCYAIENCERFTMDEFVFAPLHGLYGTYLWSFLADDERDGNFLDDLTDEKASLARELAVLMFKEMLKANAFDLEPLA